jgi:hypothetical protein
MRELAHSQAQLGTPTQKAEAQNTMRLMLSSLAVPGAMVLTLVLVARFGALLLRIRAPSLGCGFLVTTCYLIDRVERPYGSH